MTGEAASCGDCDGTGTVPYVGRSGDRVEITCPSCEGTGEDPGAADDCKEDTDA